MHTGQKAYIYMNVSVVTITRIKKGIMEGIYKQENIKIMSYL